MISIGVLVTNYNSWELAMECVQAHLALHGRSLGRVLLLDDCSSVPPPIVLPGGFDLVRNERNLGFAANLNKGVRLLGTDIVLIFDADARPLKPYLSVVAQEFQDAADLALLGFPTVDAQGEPTPSWDREPSLVSLLLGQQLDYLCRGRFEEGSPICIPMAAIALRRQAFEEVGGFDEQLDWLDVDFDLSMKINRSRWTLRMAPTLLAFHEGGGTPVRASDRVIKYYKSRWILLRKFGMIKNPRATKAFIVFRLCVEYILARAAGALLFRDPAARLDRARGKRRLIQYCRANYR